MGRGAGGGPKGAMEGSIKPSLLRWRGMHVLFNHDTPLLVFMIDWLDERWNEVPDDVLALLETLQSTATSEVRIFEVDFRADADYLDLFKIQPGPSVVRRLPGEDTFEVLRPGFGFTELIEFCRPAFEWRPRRKNYEGPTAERRDFSSASGEIIASPSDRRHYGSISGEIVSAPVN